MTNIRLANKIRSLREKRAWSQSHLAQAAGLSIRTIQRLEKSGECSKESLLSIAAAFDVDIEKLTSLKKETTLQTWSKKSILNFGYSGNSIFFSIRNWFSIKSDQAQKLMAVTGMLLLLVPCSYVALNIMEYNLGWDWVPNPFNYFTEDPDRLRFFNIISPVVFLGSLGLAFILNLLPFVDLDLAKKSDGWLSFFRYQGAKWNWSVIGIALLTLFIMATYFISETIGEYAIQSALQ